MDRSNRTDPTNKGQGDGQDYQGAGEHADLAGPEFANSRNQEYASDDAVENLNGDQNDPDGECSDDYHSDSRSIFIACGWSALARHT
jgi:hypothetical protein